MSFEDKWPLCNLLVNSWILKTRWTLISITSRTSAGTEDLSILYGHIQFSEVKVAAEHLFSNVWLYRVRRIFGNKQTVLCTHLRTQRLQTLVLYYFTPIRFRKWKFVFVLVNWGFVIFFERSLIQASAKRHFTSQVNMITSSIFLARRLNSSSANPASGISSASYQRHRVSNLACDQDVKLNSLRPKRLAKKQLFQIDSILK